MGSHFRLLAPVGERADPSYISRKSKFPLSAKLQNRVGRESEKNGPRGQDKVPSYGTLSEGCTAQILASGPRKGDLG
ncbi:hypothetical protein A6R68_17199 [Neotoma lepida]|uniref:Uncharacterized protein n=1 Tax=Neotoma lepida TaxID=56216 RepID=A0A1A6HFD3_NEOLE|nr:hypothetical protein A6R68_17199 [Neotoma lepida]